MTLDELFRDLNAKHTEATHKNDLKAIEGLIPQYENLLNQAPNEPLFMFALGTAKMQLGFNGSAINLFQQALTHIQIPELWNNLGSAWKAENNNEKAEECWRKALELREDGDYYNNLSTLYVNEGNPWGGMEYAKRGLELAPEHPRIHWNYSLLMLEQGYWKEGFEHYEYGLQSLDRPNRLYSEDPEQVPYWDGEQGRVVIYGEQGMGDEIMFASAIPDLMKEIGEENVVFDCHPRMLSMWKRNFGIECHPTRKDADISWPHEHPIDYRLAIGSLFKRYRSDGQFPRETYIKPDEELVEQYRKRLREAGDPPYVGIAWQGGAKKTNAHYRTMKLTPFVPILEQGGTFVSLQYTDGAESKCERFYADKGLKIHHWKDAVESGLEGTRQPGFNYDHTVALVHCLDLCIVPNTTVVHLCGAMGKTCWTLTPDKPAWRYGLKGACMPMYGPWVKQFRQPWDFEGLAQLYSERCWVPN